MKDLEQQRYPIGRFQRTAAPLDHAARASCIDAIEQTPSTIRSLVEHLSEAELEVPYRPGGWTLRQVVHHVPDSHMNMYIRMKLAVTEDMPTIKTYDEVRWADLPDARSAPVRLSLELLDALHCRWVIFLRSLSDAQFLRTFVHPDFGSVPLFEGLAMYAWHGRHHAAHIQTALETLSRPHPPGGRP